jgi:hypothetical protein
MYFEGLLNGSLGSRDVRAAPKNAKPGALFAEVSCIECNPTVSGLNDVAQMPLGVYQTTD